MKNKLNWLLIVGLLLIIFAILWIVVYGKNMGAFALFLGGIALFICSVLVERSAEEIAERKERQLRGELQKILNDKEHEIKDRENEIKERIKDQNLRMANIRQIVDSSAPFTQSAGLTADMVTYLYDEAAKYFDEKRPRAPRAADELRFLKRQAKLQIEESKVFQYRLEALFEIFPELEKYLDSDEGVLALSEYNNIDEFNEERDRVSDYLSPEEYRNLSEDERNQRALDRYNQRPKTPWQIGIEYEQYICYLLRGKGFTVIPFGERMGLADLGRDIVASKTNIDGTKTTYIIQCKNWSRKKKKEIHENVVCQTYGTAIEYAISVGGKEKVIPMVVSSVPLSYMATRFAEKLGVVTKVIEPGLPPQIKCNVNSSGKIYHLPFDQMYRLTEIKNPGEYYVFTVEEAVKLGFRRAHKHIF